MRGYFLESARLGFRVWTEQDFSLARDLWGDPQVTALTGGPLGESRLRQRLALEIANQQRYGIQYWPIFLKDRGDHVGCCGLRPYATEIGVFEFGLHLRPAFWAQGLGREAAHAVVGHAFAIPAISGLHAGHHPDNRASRRILETLGFRYLRDEYYPPTGLMEPCYELRKPGMAASAPKGSG